MDPAKAPETDPADWLRRWSPLLLVVASIYAYSNACKGPFLFDDLTCIVSNASLRRLWPIWTPLRPEAHLATAGRPLFGLSLAVNYAVGELNPAGYHLVNIAFHALVALALLGVLRRTLALLQHPHADGLALATSLVWSVHPLLTDAVTYITNRAEVMMALFFLVTLYALLRSLESKFPRRWLALSVVCALASVACKEVGAMILPVVFLFDVLILTGSWRKSLAMRRWYYPALLLTWIALPALLSLASFFVRAGGGSRIAPWQYLMMQSQVLLRYLRLCFWPDPLVICYVDWPIPKSLGDVWGSALIVTALVMLTLFLLVKKRPAGMIGAWCFLILAPSSSLLPLGSEPVAERRMYLPLAAILLGVFWAIERLLRRLPQGRRVGIIGTAILVIGLGQLSLWRNEDYSSTLAIWSDTVLKRPNNPRALVYLGRNMLDAGDPENAIVLFTRAMKVAPNMPETHLNRGIANILAGHFKAGLTDLGWTVRAEPSPESWRRLGWALSEARQPEACEAALKEALKLSPNDAQALRMLDELHSTGRVTP